MLVVPDEHVPEFLKILRLSDASSDRLIEVLEAAPITPESEEVTARVGDGISEVAHGDLYDIIDTLYGLYWSRAFADVSSEKFLGDLMMDVERLMEQNADVVGDADKIRRRLERLLDIGPLNTLHKAIRLQRNGERLYCEAKILSDIRPVFGEETAAKPVGAVVTHTLKLSYHEEGEHKSIFLVLDQQDLKALRDVIERANAKDISLRGLLREAKVPEFGI
jgi:hypothetical protein